MANRDETKKNLKQETLTLTDNNAILVKETQEVMLAKLVIRPGEAREVILKIISRL